LAAKNIELPVPEQRPIYIKLKTRGQYQKFLEDFPDYEAKKRLEDFGDEFGEHEPKFGYGRINTPNKKVTAQFNASDILNPPLSSLLWRTHDFVYVDLIDSAWYLFSLYI